MWRHFKPFLLCAVLVLRAPDPATAAVDIAAYYSLTGYLAQGQPRDGWEFWARYVNDTYGGILVNGKREPVNLHTFDDESNTTVTAQLFQTFVDKGYKFVIGGHTSRADLSGEFFDPHKVINIMCCTGPDSYYTKNPRKYMFGIHRSSLDYPKAFLSQMNLRKVRNVAIIFNADNGFTSSTADSAESFARNIGLNVTLKAGFPGAGYAAAQGPGYEAMRKAVEAVMADVPAPLALVFCTLHTDGQDAALIVHELGIDAAAVWISVAPTDGPRFIGRVGAGPAEYSFAPTQWDPSLQFVDPIFRNSENYVAQFRAVMGSTPSYTTASGTAAAVALHLAIEAADSLDVEAVAQAFRELREDTFFGPMAFNRYQRNYGGFTATVEIVNGRVEAVLPDTSASVQLVLPPARAMRARCPAAVSHDNFTTCAVELEQQAKARETTAVVVTVVVVVAVVLIAAAVGFYFWSQRGKRDNSAAPKDSAKPIAVMFTDIQSSTTLWATIPAEMADALHAHHTEIRVLIKKYKCYEVKTIGDAFMIVSESPERMLRLAQDLQQRFFARDWDPAIDRVYREKEEEEDSKAHRPLSDAEYRRVWNGLRVRCGLHYGKGEAQYDAVTKGYDYYGTVVNAAARIESVCHGGQVGVSEAFWEAVGGSFAGTTVVDLGDNELRGLNGPLRLYQVSPQELSNRQFPPLRLDKAEEVEDEEEDEDADDPVSGGTGRRSTVYSHVSTVRQPQFHRHPLVRSGQVTAVELRQNYEACTTVINTLLGSSPPTFRESTFKFLGKRFNVPYRGATGAQLKQVIGGLSMRVLPAMVRQRNPRPDTADAERGVEVL